MIQVERRLRDSRKPESGLPKAIVFLVVGSFCDRGLGE